MLFEVAKQIYLPSYCSISTGVIITLTQKSTYIVQGKRYRKMCQIHIKKPCQLFILAIGFFTFIEGAFVFDTVL